MMSSPCKIGPMIYWRWYRGLNNRKRVRNGGSTYLNMSFVCHPFSKIKIIKIVSQRRKRTGSEHGSHTFGFSIDIKGWCQFSELSFQFYSEKNRVQQLAGFPMIAIAHLTLKLESLGPGLPVPKKWKKAKFGHKQFQKVPQKARFSFIMCWSSKNKF